MAEQEYDARNVAQFLDEFAARNKTPVASEMRSYLIALQKIRPILIDLESAGIYALEEATFPEAERIPSTLDFVIRKKNVEIQLDVKYLSTETTLYRSDLERYYGTLEHNPKTAEILASFVDGKFSTVSLSLNRVQNILSTLNGDKYPVPKQMLCPLKNAITDAFNRYMHSWVRSSEIAPAGVSRQRVQDSFASILTGAISDLKKSAYHRRYPERISAIESLDEQDLKCMERLYREGQTSDLSLEYIEKELQRHDGPA